MSSESPLVGVPQISSPDVPPDVSHSSSPASDVEVAANSLENISWSGSDLRYLNKKEYRLAQTFLEFSKHQASYSFCNNKT